MRKNLHEGGPALLDSTRLAALLRDDDERQRPGVKTRDHRVWDEEMLNHCVGLVIVPLVEENWPRVLEVVKLWWSMVRQRRTRIPLQEILELPLGCTTISVRTQTYLEQAGYNTVGDVVRSTRERLLDGIPQVGPGCLAEVIAAFKQLGLGASDDVRHTHAGRAGDRDLGWHETLLDAVANARPARETTDWVRRGLGVPSPTRQQKAGVGRRNTGVRSTRRGGKNGKRSGVRLKKIGFGKMTRRR